jgi:hypothetical protein
MSRIVIVILIFHRHKPVDSINLLDLIPMGRSVCIDNPTSVLYQDVLADRVVTRET